MTIKEVAEKTGVSALTVKKNIGDLLTVLPVRKRVAVLEFMIYCKKIRHRRGFIQEASKKVL